MTKWILWIGIPVVIAICCIYWFIPRRLTVVNQIPVKCTISGANRTLQHFDQWRNWWPASPDRRNALPSSLHMNGFSFDLQDVFYNRVSLTATSDAGSPLTYLTLLPVATDSLHVLWSFDISTGNDPVSKISSWFQARKLARTLEDLLENLKAYLEEPVNIYGFDIRDRGTPKTYLVATSFSSAQFPPTPGVYDAINHLQQYVLSSGARQTGYPMLHVSQPDSARYEAMVALPVDRQLSDSGDIRMRRIVTIRSLTTRVTGGPHTIQRALDELSNYVNDYKLFSPAIPFESLITNRLSVPDTSVWVTEVYQPLL